MNSGRDPFEILRSDAHTTEPTSAQTERARARLERAINAQRIPSAASGSRRARRVLVAAAVAAALIVVAIPLLNTSTAQAALTEVAQAARQATALDIPEGNYIKVTSERTDLGARPGEEFGLEGEFVAYLLPTTREVWRQPAERFFSIRTTVGQPVFIDPQTESAYYTAGLDEDDRVGETYIEQFTDVADPIIETDWPTDPINLRQSMEAFIGDNRGTTATDADLFILASNILREANPPPELRGAVIEVLAQLPVTLERPTADSFALSITDRDRELAMTLTSKGNLIAETITLLEPDSVLGIPAGTVLTNVTYQPTSVVNTLPSDS